MPPVAATLSWKPIDHTNHGSSTISTNTAPARIEAVAPGRPMSTPTNVRVAMTPARITEGSAPVSTTKNTTVPEHSRNRGHRVRPTHAANARMGASTMATFSPLTTNRCPRPVAWKSRASPGSNRESSPRTNPSSSPASFGGKSREMEVPTNARNTWVARTNGLGAPPSRSNSESRTATAMPFRRSDSENPGSSGRSMDPSRRTRSPRTARGMASSPPTHTDSRIELAPPSHSTRVTSTTADHPKVLAVGSTLRVPSKVTRAGARPAKADPLTRASCSPPHPSASEKSPSRMKATTMSPGVAEAPAAARPRHG